MSLQEERITARCDERGGRCANLQASSNSARDASWALAAGQLTTAPPCRGLESLIIFSLRSGSLHWASDRPLANCRREDNAHLLVCLSVSVGLAAEASAADIEVPPIRHQIRFGPATKWTTAAVQLEFSRPESIVLESDTFGQSDMMVTADIVRGNGWSGLVTTCLRAVTAEFGSRTARVVP